MKIVTTVGTRPQFIMAAAVAQCRQQVILPLHPRTRKKLDEFRVATPATIILTDPVGYLDMVRLEEGTSVIATDSGGVQKEAFFHGVPCVTLRDETEWTELVELGANNLAGTNPQLIHTLVESAIGATVPDAKPYGNGNASELIASFFERLA